MSHQEKPSLKRRSFNLFDVLVVGVFLIGLPLGFWAYSTAQKSLEEDGGNLMASWGISGPDYASQTFRVVLSNHTTLQTIISKMVPGEVVFDEAARRPIGMLRGVKLVNGCRSDTYNKARLQVCSIKVTVDLRCVEGTSEIRCLKRPVRIGGGLTLITKFFRFNGNVIDIQRLEFFPATETSGDHPPPSGEKVSQKTSGDHPPPSGEKVSQKTSGDHPPPSGEKVSQKISGDHPPPSREKVSQKTLQEEE